MSSVLSNGQSHTAKDDIELADRDDTSEHLPMLSDEQGDSHEYRDERDGSAQHGEKYLRRTPFTRFLEFLRIRNKPYAAHVHHHDDGAAAPLPQGFFATLRTIFNYPEPNIELRNTAWLDGLRGLAAFEVFIFHYDDGWVDRTLGWGTGDFLDPAWWRAPFIRTFFAAGDAAVCLFFAISGYVLSHRILTLYRQRRHEEAYSSLSSAVFRRAIRLYMPVAIETFILMLLCRWFNFPKPVVYESAETFLGEISQYITSFVHLLLPLRYPDRWDMVINRYDGGISWTIPLEYYGSIVIFVVLLFVSRVRNMAVRLTLILAMVWQSFIKDDWIAGQFLLGMAFADWQIGKEFAKKRQQGPTIARKQWLHSILAWMIFLFGFYMAGLPLFHLKKAENGGVDDLFSRPFYNWISRPLAYYGLYQNRQTDRYLQCLAGFALLVGVGETPILRRIMETRFVQYLGRISFGLYLCHIFLHALLKPLDKYYVMIVGLDPTVPLPERKESLQLFIAYLLMLIPSMTVNFFVGGCFERFLDKPSVNAGKRFEKWCLSRGKDDAPPSLPHGTSAMPPPVITISEAQENDAQSAQFPVRQSIRLR
jgi:peptidoglycan/LPS O-acetylase OafA/YrhL